MNSYSIMQSVIQFLDEHKLTLDSTELIGLTLSFARYLDDMDTISARKHNQYFEDPDVFYAARADELQRVAGDFEVYKRRFIEDYYMEKARHET